MSITDLTYDRLHSLSNHPGAQRLGRWILLHRLWIIIGIHIFLFALSYIYSGLLLNARVIDEETFETLYRTLLPLLLIRLGVFWYHDLYQSLWRYVSFQDLLNIIRAAVISSMLFYIAGILWSPLKVSEELYLLDLTFCVMFVGGIRLVARNIHEKYKGVDRLNAVENILLVGPLRDIQPVAKEFIADPKRRYNPVAIIDVEKEDRTSLTRVSDIPVFSLSQALARVGRIGASKAIVFCWPEAARRQLDSVVEKLTPLQVPFRTVPRVEDILSGKVSISDIREVEIEDLLERPPVKIEMDRVREYLQDKTILITGGGGSIGSELSRQITGFKPKMLVLVERSEQSLFDLQMELSGAFPDLAFYGSILSVNDGPGLTAFMKRMKVDVVFHAAAYKHVPLMEKAPVECAYNNILGTYNVARASLEAGVRRFVMISTDKAVNPLNVMGVTKRIAEMLVQSYAGSVSTRFMTVRFGNVLGSAGSVIPIFKKQILEGKPLTVTHPDIERYFMTIPESVQLVLQAGCMGNGGEIFVLDMGNPVKIMRLAEKLITLSGKRPREDVEIKITGIRPGEKMYEELFNRGEHQLDTSHPQILMALSKPVENVFMLSQIEEIRRLVVNHDEEGLRLKFRELVPEYLSETAPVRAKPEPGMVGVRGNISEAIL